MLKLHAGLDLVQNQSLSAISDISALHTTSIDYHQIIELGQAGVSVPRG